MKFVKKSQAIVIKNSDACMAVEYPMDEKALNGSVVVVKGRYPETGRIINEKCKEMAYVITGDGRVVVEGKEIILGEEDLIMLEPGERYHWEGNMKMFIFCSPAWYPGQYKAVD